MKKKSTHLRALEGKSKSEKKKIRKEFEEVKERLEKAQAKYVQKPKRQKATTSKAENKKWEQKRKDRYNQRVWKGWRDKDMEEYPVKTYNIKDIEKDT
ncbi:hypothetical protein [Virgibacillus siamensis]|uniref:hypothetical protein n=1 Tax=Virgibacillus siamensis TaxID=480071 RepID=UPI0009845CA9|nr:hypothetical protein [Virgibacillus siamensis]